MIYWGNHTRLNCIMQDLVNGFDLLIWRRMEDNDDGADQADGAAQLAQRTQFLLQEIRPEDGADKNAEGAKRGHENGGREGIGGKVTDLANTDCGLAVSLDRRRSRAQDSSRVAMPAHHSGFLRYTKPSPSNPCRSSACIRPLRSWLATA